jgi:hypothetical protein
MGRHIVNTISDNDVFVKQGFCNVFKISVNIK